MLPKIGSLLIYIGTFVLWLYLNSVYYNFGTKIITPLTGAMWILGAVLAMLLPSQRQDIIKHTKWFAFCNVKTNLTDFAGTAN